MYIYPYAYVLNHNTVDYTWTFCSVAHYFNPHSDLHMLTIITVTGGLAVHYMSLNKSNEIAQTKK